VALKGQPFKKLFGVLKTVAPTLLAGAAGPFGPLVMGIAKQVLGDEKMTDDQLEEAVASAAGTTEGLTKIREMETRAQEVEAGLKVRFAELEVQQEEGLHKDRADARARQIAMKDNAPMIVLIITSIGFYGALAYIFTHGFPADAKDVLLMMLGPLGGAWLASVQFYVGSSSGSKIKTEMMASK